MSITDALTAFVQAEFEKVANPEKAAQMQAYFKTDMPIYGTLKPDREPVFREMKKRFVPADHEEYEGCILALWVLPYREEKWAAIAYAGQHPEYITLESVPLYERLIREGAWWDLVDSVAIDLIGKVLLDEREAMTPVVAQYVEDPNMWIRRTSLIAHNRHREQTNEAQLFDHCIRLAPEKEFFIRKAIGWALREYSKTAPEAVRGFLAEHQERSARHLVRQGLM